MSKLFRIIVGAIEVVAGVITGNPYLIAQGTLMIVSALTMPTPPPPETTQRSIKVPIPTRIRGYGPRRLYGASILYETSRGGTTGDVFAFHDGKVNSLLHIYLNDDEVTLSGGAVVQLADKSYQHFKMFVGFNLGLPTETAFSRVVTEFPGTWTNNHRGDGVCTGFILKYQESQRSFTTTYPNGDNVELSAAFELAPLFDFRDGAQDAYDPATWVYSENACLAYLHYLITQRGVDFDTRIQPQIASWTAAADDCDTAMDLATGGTEPRYRTCVVYKATDEPATVIDQLLACFDGWSYTNERGEIVVYSGTLYEPSVDIGPDQIATYHHEINVRAEDAPNEILVSYISAEHKYATVDATPWRDEDAIAASGRDPNSIAMTTQSPSFRQNRRLAKRRMSRANAPDRGTITTTYAGRAVVGERFINLRVEEAGAVFFDGIAEIVSPPERDMQSGGVTFDWISVDPNIDAWNPETEDGVGAPVGDPVVLYPLETPTIDSATAIFDTAVDNSGAGVRVSIDVDDPGMDYLTWFARWRRDSSSIWNEQRYEDIDPAAGLVTLLTDFVPVTAALEVEVSYRSGDGRNSDWSDPTEIDTRTDVTVPDAAVAVTLISWSDTLNLSTDRIARASSYRWRFYEDDGTTLKRTIVTNIPQVSYTAAQAKVDGVQRSYIVEVAGVNAAGAGTVATSGTLSNAAPVAITGFTATGGATEAEVEFDLSVDTDVAGYVVYISTAPTFDPNSQGTAFKTFATPTFLSNISAGTFYTKMAAYDAWSDNPGLLIFTSETSFVITTGGGGVGGGGGDGGGGYDCPEVDTLILMANEAHDGPGEQKRAGDVVVVEDWVWTQHEVTMEWGAYQISAVRFVEEAVWSADIGVKPLRATAAHRVWLSGWVRIDALGVPDGEAMVANITVADAHTYIANGILNHNIKT